ncbi:MAG: trypsin-like peptidase domain-containing protein [Candidatus Saccharimonadales bacterium]
MKNDEIITPSDQKPAMNVRKNHTLQFVIGAIILVLICFAAGFGGNYLSSLLNGSSSLTSREQVQQDGNQLASKEEEDIAGIAAKVGPSVVSIITQSPGSASAGAQESAGTGIIVGADGYVLTNKHVIDGAATVQVTLSDGTVYENVDVLGTDPLNDVAFLKIKDAHNLPAAQLGDSTSVKIGQKVVAIGNSLGQYDNTVTSGIISGVGRPISAQAGNSVENLTDLIQTDAAINPGNSGGPLLNMQGQVIGLNTAVAQDAQGIGFSIPINATKGILKGVLAGGKVQRAFLGVNYISVNTAVAKQYGLTVKNGAYVYKETGSAVGSGSPADKAGIKDKDIITKVGDIDVGIRGSVSSLIAEYAPGDTIQLTILRGNQTLTVKVTLAPYAS